MYALRLEAGQWCDPAIPVDVNRGVIGLGFCCAAIRDCNLAIGCFPAIIDGLFYPISPHALSKLLGIRMGGITMKVTNTSIAPRARKISGLLVVRNYLARRCRLIQDGLGIGARS